MFFLLLDIKSIDDFCDEMKTGLDVNEIYKVALKYDIGSKRLKNPNAVKDKKLGSQVTDRKSTRFFAVGAGMTMGEHCLYSLS